MLKSDNIDNLFYYPLRELREKKQLAELETTRISYREKYTDKHPRMIDLEDRIGQLMEKIREERRNIVRELLGGAGPS